MPLAKRMAVTLPASPFIKDSVERVKWAEANGYTDAWFGDGGAPDALTRNGSACAPREDAAPRRGGNAGVHAYARGARGNRERDSASCCRAAS